MYDLRFKTRITDWSVSNVATEELVRKYISELLASEGLPRPASLTADSFAASLAETGAYEETVRDGRITVTRSALP